ncbi:hypothetical protein GCM10023187_18600 [Nibrella viscosa]|uniref:Glycosyltransferase 2-like domain-containing protein n=1 Tax=Nibrella viscosa TaxID=1084524 RepID=A0ABP8KAC3_9BACT
MNKTPLVSIIIDNYNYGRFLRAAIDSARQQTYTHTEVIVVDDGSTDDSAAIIREYGNAITAILKANGGQASAFNEGFKVSRGEIIIFLDADDTLLPTAIEQVVNAFDSPEVAKVHWPMWRIDGAGRRSGGVVPAHPLAEGDLREGLVHHGPAFCCGTAYGAPTSGNAWSRRFLNQVFPLPEADFRTGGVDFYLFVLAPVYGPIRRLTEPQGFYRVHGSNDTLKSIEPYLQTYFGWFGHAWQALYEHLSVAGVPVDITIWKRDSWFHRIYLSLQEIDAAVPPAARFILVDENYWGTGDLVAGRRCIPFPEQDGQYWGAPADDAAAIREIERQRGNGAATVVFAWPSFWWLDHYRELHQFLRTQYPCMLENDRLIIFNLQPA